MALEKPKSITVTLGDRKANKFISFVVYGMTLGDVEKKIKKTLTVDESHK